MSTSTETFFELSREDGARTAISIQSSSRGMRGASGTVYQHPKEPGKAIKIYHEPERSKFEEKIRTMIRVKYNRPYVEFFDFAWPETVVTDTSGRFCGFKMPFFGTNWIDLESLMQASEAEKNHKIGERERLTISANLAMAVKELHLLGVYCIDLKPQNIRVNLHNLEVGIIDCDGMSVIDIGATNSKRFFADKSTPEFWAPENIGIKPQNFKDEEAHDRFALAVIVFMLINRGIHPYQGVMSFEIPGAETTAGKIKNNLYPYGAGKGRIAPHQDSLYPFWSAETKSFFDRAFSTIAARPSADHWWAYLCRLVSESEVCGKNPQFHVRHPQVGCPVCARDEAAAKSNRGRPRTTYPSGSAFPQKASISPTGAPAAGRQGGVMPVVSAAPLAPAQHGSPLVSTPPSPAPWIGLGLFPVAAVVLLLVAGLWLGSGPATAPQCARQDVWNEALKGGAAALRKYIGECQPNGIFVAQAKERLEPLVHADASACIRRECDAANLNRCVQSYSEALPSGPRLASLQSDVATRKKHDQCQPFCSQRSEYDAAIASRGVSSLRSYVDRCQSGGLYIYQARDALSARERVAYDGALSCIARECSSGALRSCIESYAADFPSESDRAGNLRTEANRAGNSDRCNVATEAAGDIATANGDRALNQQNDNDRARAYYEQALKIYTSLPNRNSPSIKRKIGTSIGLIGILDTDSARGCNLLGQARVIWIELGDARALTSADNAARVLGCARRMAPAGRPGFTVGPGPPVGVPYQGNMPSR